jgi:hypothetical protein
MTSSPSLAHPHEAQVIVLIDRVVTPLSAIHAPWEVEVLPLVDQLCLEGPEDLRARGDCSP